MGFCSSNWTGFASCMPKCPSWRVPEQLAITGAQNGEGPHGIEQEEQRISFCEIPYNVGANWRIGAPEVLAVAFPPGVELAIVLPRIEGTIERNGAGNCFRAVPEQMSVAGTQDGHGHCRGIL